MILRTLIITCSLIFSLAATAQDMSTWSDKTLCRLQNTLHEDTLYLDQVRKRGLVCPPADRRKALYERPFSLNATMENISITLCYLLQDTLYLGQLQSRGSVCPPLDSGEAPYRKAFYQSTSAQCQPTSLPIENNLPTAPHLDLRDHIAVKSSIFTSHTTAKLLIAHDFNGDGIDDLIVNAGLPEINLILLTGQPSGLFIDQPLANAKGATGKLNRLQLVDANQDQWPDLLAFNVNGPIQLFINQQGQGFKAVLLAAEHLPTGSMGGVLVDLNGDGIAELAAISHLVSNPQSPLKGQGEWLFENTLKAYSPLLNWHHSQDIAAGDLNNDGYQDLVISLSANAETDPVNPATTPKLEGSLYIVYGDGDLNFEDNQHAFLGLSTDIGGPIRLIDLNGDQQLDIVQAYSTQVDADTYHSGLRAYLNMQGQNDCFIDISAQLLPDIWQQPWLHSHSSSHQHAINSIQLTDANQDGRLDMWLQLRSDLKGSGLLLQQDNQFRTATLIHGDTSLAPKLSGDFNGDGLNDVVQLIKHEKHIEIQPWLHTSKQLNPLAPYQPDNFANLGDQQVQLLQAFIQDKFVRPVPWVQLFEGSSAQSTDLAPTDWQGNYLMAWYWLAAKSEKVDYLGMDNVRLDEQGLTLTTQPLFKFRPSRPLREALSFERNRHGQFIMRGKLDVRADQAEQAIELFGHVANRAALGIMDDGSIVLLELIDP